MRSQLGQRGHPVPKEVPGFLHERIMASVRREPNQGRMNRLTPIGIGLAASAAILAILLVTRGDFERTHPMQTTATPTVEKAGPTVLQEVNLDWNSGDRLLAWAGTMETPLHREMDRVIADARSAVNSLAGEFLPGGLKIKKTSLEDSVGRSD